MRILAEFLWFFGILALTIFLMRWFNKRKLHR
jgi:hypothetical protein